MNMYRRVRLACAEGMSQREAARNFNISRDSVAKIIAFSVPPGYRRKWECLKLCVSDRVHAVFRYVQASKRPVNIMAS